MARITKTLGLVAVLGLTTVVGIASAQPYRYVDEQGVPHWVQSLDQIPEHYRDKSGAPRLPSVDTKQGRGARDSDEIARTRSMEALCREAVLDRLKAPGTAKFTRMLPSGRYKLTGEVDAHNSYGGLLRSTFACEFSAGGSVERVDMFTRR